MAKLCTFVIALAVLLVFAHAQVQPRSLLNFVFRDVATKCPVPGMNPASAAIAAQPDLTTFYSLLQSSGLLNDLALPYSKGYTIFAPTNAAFAAIAGSLATLQANPKALLVALKNHVLPLSAVKPLDFSTGSYVPMSGQPLSLVVPYAGRPLITVPSFSGSTANVNRTVGASNAVIYVIDKVLLPANTIPQALQAAGLTSLFNALTTASTTFNLLDKLYGPGPFTLIAPSNAAFAAAQATLSGLTQQQLTSALKYHILPFAVTPSSLALNPSLTGVPNVPPYAFVDTLLYNQFIKILPQSSSTVQLLDYTGTPAHVNVSSAITVGNGIIIPIDKVLLASTL